MKKQELYCRLKNVPMFAPKDGVCWNCNKPITDKGDTHITGCEHCNTTYCE